MDRRQFQSSLIACQDSWEKYKIRCDKVAKELGHEGATHSTLVGRVVLDPMTRPPMPVYIISVLSEGNWIHVGITSRFAKELVDKCTEIKASFGEEKQRVSNDLGFELNDIG